MKKITAILFLSVYLLSATELVELLKINTLVQHFYETNNTGKHVGFLSFLVMHYITDDLDDKDNDQDKQLPFKSTESSISNSTILYITVPGIKLLTTHFLVLNNPVIQIQKDWVIVTNFNSPVWHPPKYS